MHAYAIDSTLVTPQAREHLLRVGRLSRREQAKLNRAHAVQLDPTAWTAARERLLIGMAGRLAEPMTEDAITEAQLMLYADPELRLEYVGRGSVIRRLGPDETDRVIKVDRPGGRRRYYLRKVAPNDPSPLISPESRDTLADFGRWVSDPDAKLVVSIGGGGFRLFSVTMLFKVLDYLTGDRSRIAEVWGSSGGALAGYVFSQGFEATTLDDLGFDLCHNRNPALVNGSASSLLKMGARLALEKFRDRRGQSEMERWLDHLDARQPSATRRHPRIPLYSVAVNPGRKGLHALAAREHIPSYCEDILMPCNPRAAVAASTAVPFLLRSERGITGLERDVWIDGSLTDEHPITLPFVKWKRERVHEPERARSKLRVLLIDLNMRTSESPIVRSLSKLPWIGTVGVKRAARVFDILLDSRLCQVVQLLGEMPDVEIRCVKLALGRLGLKDPGDIPSVILGGRQAGAWEVISFRGTM